MSCVLVLCGENCLSTLSPRIPPAVYGLLSGPLDTFEKLEVAVGLSRAPAQTSSVAELVRATGTPRDSVERGARALIELELVESSGGLLRLVPPASQAPAYAELLQVYDADRVLIVQAVSEIAMGKIRGMAARTFAEAFASSRKKSDDSQ